MKNKLKPSPVFSVLCELSLANVITELSSDFRRCRGAREQIQRSKADSVSARTC